MEIFVVIVLVIVVLCLWRVNGHLTNIQNTLFSIDSNLDSLKDRFASRDLTPMEFEELLDKNNL